MKINSFCQTETSTGHRWIPLTKASDRRWALMFSFVCFYLRTNKRLSKQLRHRWFETPSRSLRRHCNVNIMSASLCPWRCQFNKNDSVKRDGLLHSFGVNYNFVLYWYQVFVSNIITFTFALYFGTTRINCSRSVINMGSIVFWCHGGKMRRLNAHVVSSKWIQKLAVSYSFHRGLVTAEEVGIIIDVWDVS